MNNLSSREKVLVYVVVAILPVIVLFFGFSYFMGQLKQKSVELTSVTKQLSDIQFREDQATVKTLLQNQFKQRSLASDVSIAQSEYREWLQGLAEKEVKFDGPPKVTPKASVPFKSDFGQKPVLYTKMNYQLECSGSYKQIVDFLYRFYEKNYLHRISRLDFSVQKGKESGGKLTTDRNRFSVKAQIEVLSLTDADEERNPMAVENTKLFYRAKDKDTNLSELNDYYQLVLRRNLFGFPNNAPDFGSRKKEFEFEEGDRISLKLSADDKDNDDLEFSLVSTDSKVDSKLIEQSRAGSFKLDIDEIGEYEFKAQVVDKNYYPKADDMTVVVVITEKKATVKREDPPPPAPKFDPLKFTTLEAIVQNLAGEPRCWIYIRPLDKLYKLGVGGEFEVGKSTGKIISINRRDAVIEVNGDQYRFEVNDFLGNPTKGSLVKAGKSDETDPGKTEGTESSESATSAESAEKPEDDVNGKSTTESKADDQPKTSGESSEVAETGSVSDAAAPTAAQESDAEKKDETKNEDETKAADDLDAGEEKAAPKGEEDKGSKK